MLNKAMQCSLVLVLFGGLFMMCIVEYKQYKEMHLAKEVSQELVKLNNKIDDTVKNNRKVYLQINNKMDKLNKHFKIDEKLSTNNIK